MPVAFLLAVGVDERVLLAHECAEVETHLGGREAGVPGVSALVVDRGSLDQILRRETPPVNAGAAEGPRLGHRDSLPEARGHDRVIVTGGEVLV